MKTQAAMRCGIKLINVIGLVSLWQKSGCTWVPLNLQNSVMAWTGHKQEILSCYWDIKWMTVSIVVLCLKFVTVIVIIRILPCCVRKRKLLHWTTALPEVMLLATSSLIRKNHKRLVRTSQRIEYVEKPKSWYEWVIPWACGAWTLMTQGCQLIHKKGLCRITQTLSFVGLHNKVIMQWVKYSKVL